MDLQGAAHQIAQGVELIDHSDRVVVDVTEVHDHVGGEHVDIAPNDGVQDVSHWYRGVAELLRVLFHPKDLAQDTRADRPILEEHLLQTVDAVLKCLRDGYVTVDDRIENGVEQEASAAAKTL